MKRDPRLRRSGERRSPRPLGRAARPLWAETQRLYKLLGLSPRLVKLTGSMATLGATSRRVQEAWVEHVLTPFARYETERLQLRDDLALHGEAFVRVDWDDVGQRSTVERIPPDEIQGTYRWPPDMVEPEPGVKPSDVVREVASKWMPWPPPE